MVIVSFFLLKYIRGAAFSIHPDLMDNVHAVMLDLIFSGVLAGFLLGRVAKYIHVFTKK
jgi:hypothetical protein